MNHQNPGMSMFQMKKCFDELRDSFERLSNVQACLSSYLRLLVADHHRTAECRNKGLYLEWEGAMSAYQVKLLEFARAQRELHAALCSRCLTRQQNDIRATLAEQRHGHSL